MPKRIYQRDNAMMKSFLAAAAVAVSLISTSALAQSAERSITLEVDAKVLNVFPDTRTVVLDNASTGQTEFIVAGPEVLNFDQIEVGDEVKAVYTVGLAARMALPGEVDTITELEAQAAEGEKPGGAAGTAVTLVLEFMSFDAATSEAVVKTADGVEQTIEVASDEGREFAAGLVAGDKVALTFTEGVAVVIVTD